MIFFTKILLSILVVLLFAGIGLRARKLRRDESRGRSAQVDHRLMTPPPSPYVPSRGFRLLDEAGNVAPLTRPQPARPRLETDREYVFGDPHLPTIDETASNTVRHDSRWALERSSHRSPTSRMRARTLFVAVLVVLVVVGVAYAMRSRHSLARPVVTTPTSTGTTTASGTQLWPSMLVATSVTGQSASYSVPADKYQVTVHGSRGAVWVVYRMGPTRTLEYQGRVSMGQSKTLEMTGSSQITLGSPLNATMNVGASQVQLPSAPPTPETLIFTPRVTPAG